MLCLVTDYGTESGLADIPNFDLDKMFPYLLELIPEDMEMPKPSEDDADFSKFFTQAFLIPGHSTRIHVILILYRVLIIRYYQCQPKDQN